MLIQAEAGLVSITGTPDTAVKTGIPTSDIAAGMYAAQSALAALLRRCRTGEGATIDVAMLDTTVEWMGHALYTQMHTGAQPPRMGLSHSSIAPYRRVQHRTMLARTILTATRYTRGDDEAHTLIRTALAASGAMSSGVLDLIPAS